MSDYDTDLLLWSVRQAILLRRAAAGEMVNDHVDWENVAEEIESLGKSDRRELSNRIRTILTHLIKLQTSPVTEPRPGWREMIREQRAVIETVLDDSPSMRSIVPAIIRKYLPPARREALASLADHNERPLVDPTGLEFTADQVLGLWMP
jgi:hypothetical protein